MLIHGKCHCGNITLELDWKGDPPEIPARACGCSFCVKHGGVWTSSPQSRLVVTIGDPSLVSKYAFGSRTATFQVCSRCGTVPLVTSEIANHLYAVVNVNVLENIDQSWLRRATANFDGEDVESRLARRKRNWIADVRIRTKGAPNFSLDRTPIRSDGPMPPNPPLGADARRRSSPSPLRSQVFTIAAAAKLGGCFSCRPI